MTDDQARRNREHWTRQARQHGSAPAATWGDVPAMELERDQVGRHLRDGDRVLDVGCGNGFTSLALATARAIELVGLDAVPEMVAAAEAEASRRASELRGTARFEAGDLRELGVEDESFDVCMGIRVLINLGDRAEQDAAVRRCLRAVRPGGLLIFSEAHRDGWQRLNRMRREWGLDDLPEPAFNNYLKTGQLSEALADDAELVEDIDFSSSYYVATRVIKPLLAGLLGTSDTVADPTSEWNRFAAAIPPFGDYGIQRLVVHRRR